MTLLGGVYVVIITSGVMTAGALLAAALNVWYVERIMRPNGS
jgi:uncharacterized membrane protein